MKCFTLHAMNQKYMKVSLFEITYKKKWTFLRHSNLLRCTCTYRVVLYPSYLQRVFSFIIFIKERDSFKILSEKSQAPGRAPWAELKSDKHLSAYCQQNTDIWCRFTYHLQFWIMTGIFYSWDRSIFQYQTMCKSSVELGLVYKTFVNKHTCKTLLLPRKNKPHPLFT